MTDLALGLDQAKVRIVSIEEDDNGLLTVVAEELVSGIGTAAANPSAGSGGPQHSFAQTAVAVNDPLLYQPPTSLTGGVAQIWAGASPQASGASTQWGGCNIYASLDGTTYAQVATITQPVDARACSRPICRSPSPAPTRQHALGRPDDEQRRAGRRRPDLGLARRHPSVVDNELVSFTNATLTAASAYNLTGLYRGMSGSTPAAHATGAPFARLDSAVLVTYDIPAGMVGADGLFQVPVFNAFGGGEQDLSDCAVYPDHRRQRRNLASDRHPVAVRLAGRSRRRSTSRRPSSTTSAGSRRRSATSSTSATSASCRTRSQSSWRAASRSTSAPSSA